MICKKKKKKKIARYNQTSKHKLILQPQTRTHEIKTHVLFLIFYNPATLISNLIKIKNANKASVDIIHPHCMTKNMFRHLFNINAKIKLMK